MPIKYQVFVSSTYTDLKEERDAVLKAILEMSHIPIGMEMFSAADEEQWEIIKRHIEESDYYLVVVAHRYGSVVDGVSFTEKEYDYAVERGVPVLGFVIDDAAPWPNDRRDRDADGSVAAAFGRFKEKVKRKPVSFWNNAADLHGKAAIALQKQITVRPRRGWVPASDAAGPEVLAELSRLSSENAALRKKLDSGSGVTVQTSKWARCFQDKQARRVEPGPDGVISQLEFTLDAFNGAAQSTGIANLHVELHANEQVLLPVPLKAFDRDMHNPYLVFQRHVMDTNRVAHLNLPAREWVSINLTGYIEPGDQPKGRGWTDAVLVGQWPNGDEFRKVVARSCDANDPTSDLGIYMQMQGSSSY